MIVERSRSDPYNHIHILLWPVVVKKTNAKKWQKIFQIFLLQMIECCWMMKNEKKTPVIPCVSWIMENQKPTSFLDQIRPNTHGRYRYAGSIFGSSLRLGFKVQNVVWINNTIKVWLSDPIGKQLHILIVWWQCVCIKRDKTLTLTHTGRFMAIHSWMLNHVQLVNLYLLFIFTNFYKCDWVEHFI